MLGLQKSFQVCQLVQATKFYMQQPRLRLGYEFNRFKPQISTGVQEKSPYGNLSTCSHIKSKNAVSFRLSPTIDEQALKRDIIKFIKPIIGIKKSDSFAIKQRSVVILATPSYIARLENINIQSYLNDLAKDCVDASTYEIDVICACVDGLTPSVRELDHGQGKDIFEGISILWGTSIINNLELWPSLPPRLAKPDDQCCLIIQQKLDDNTHPLFQVTVPLANTIFKNGRRSTLSVSKFQISSGGVKTIESPTYRLCVSICNFTNDEEIFIKIPARPLTAPREIEEGFGNIIKSLRIEGTRSIPASHELEKAVMESFDFKTSDQCHKIWALIIPANIRNEKNNNSLFLDCFGNQEFDSSYLENSIRQGAKLCQVLSGGGGWGSKVGLLALDPNSVHDNVTQAEMNPNMFTHEAHVETIMNIVQKNALIQFVQTYNEGKSTLSPTKNHCTQSQIMLGTSETNAKLSKVDNTAHFSIPGLFGCVSESGIFLQSTKTGSTKINIPYSYIYSQCLEK